MKNKIKTTLILLFTLSLMALFSNSIAGSSKSNISVEARNCPSTSSSSNLAIKFKIDDNKNNWPRSTVIKEGSTKTLTCATDDGRCYVKCVGATRGENKDKTIHVRDGDKVYCKLVRVNVSRDNYKWSMQINRNQGCN